MRRIAPASILALALLAPAAIATAAGGPVAGAPADGRGVAAAGSPWRFVTLQVDARRAVVMRIARADGRVVGSRRLRGGYQVSAAAVDGTGTGASADGHTLVLSRPSYRFPQRRTRFEVLDGLTMRLQPPIRLRGHFTVDAVSPDGRLLYLVQYTSARDINDYVVRAYDMKSRRLRPGAVVDPDEADEPMRGMPVARASSADGRWAYTLYDGGGTHPFVHALDTEKAAAVCVDLDELAGRDDLWSMTLDVTSSGAVLVRSGGAILSIDPHTFAVSDPAAPPRLAPAHAGEGGGGDGPAWAAGALAALALLAAAAWWLRRARIRRVALR